MWGHSVLVIGDDGSSSSGCVDVGVGGNSDSSSPKCVSPAQQWNGTTPLPQMESVVSVDTSVSVLHGSASDIVGLLVVVSIEVSAAEDVAAVGVGLDASGVAG